MTVMPFAPESDLRMARIEAEALLAIRRACDWTRPLNRLSIGPELRRAMIVHRGTLTPRFAHLHEAMKRAVA